MNRLLCEDDCEMQLTDVTTAAQEQPVGEFQQQLAHISELVCLTGEQAKSTRKEDERRSDDECNCSNGLKLFDSRQRIDEIRERKKLFVDERFRPSIDLVVVDRASNYCKSLFAYFNCKNRFDLNELVKKIKWQRCQVTESILLLKYNSKL